MDHIRQFDWCTSSGHPRYFIEESALDNCNTEKIITNRFIDPLISSDEEDHPPNVINWDEVFKDNDPKKSSRIFVPGLRPVAAYPKLSSLTEAQHHKGLRVLCTMYPNVLEDMKYIRPTLIDRKNFEALKEAYQKEQKEYIEWAKSVWVSTHCLRALRPKPAVETIYEAEFKVRAQRLSGYPHWFDMAAQIPLECTKGQQYEFTLKDTFVDINIRDLPQVSIPQPILKLTSIIRPCSVPEPCHKHPYPFIMPSESSVSVLPITELHRELAQFCAERGAKFIASENALRCLLEFNRHWSIPVTVSTAFNQDGESCNVIVLDSEFALHKEPSTHRTYKAFRHLLQHALVPSAEMEKSIERMKKNREKKSQKEKEAAPSKDMFNDLELSSDDDEPLALYIMEDGDGDNNCNNDKAGVETEQDHVQSSDRDKLNSPTCKNKCMAQGDVSMDDINDIIGVYNCTCSDSLYELPPRRSFKKWQITNRSTHETIDLIVHCAHKARKDSNELLLEPVPEYQLELGGSEQSPDRLRTLALALMLRKNVALLTARIDACNGDLVTLEHVEGAELLTQLSAQAAQAHNVLHTALAELQGLVPGHYVLRHEPSHFANALLYVSRSTVDSTLELKFDSAQLIEHDEGKLVKVAPTITPVLLPYHKFRHILPCAFTPHPSHLQKDNKKAANKQKTPPQALKFPRRKNKKKKKK